MASRRILFYIHALAGGGAERVFVLLASQFARRGHSVTMVNDYSASDKSVGLDPQVRSIVIGRHHLVGVSRLRSILQEEKPDLILAGLGASNLKMTIAHLGRASSSALVLTYHSRFAPERRPLGRLGYILTPLITRIADWTIAVSKDLERTIIDIWGAAPHKTSFIYNPVAVPSDARNVSASSLTERADVVLTVGRLAPEKDYISLIRAFAKLNRPQADLIIVGDGPERQKLQGETDRLGLAGRVQFPGYVSEPWSFYKRAKCFALTSTSESFGNVVVEALAHGLPVIATNAPGPVEILEHGRYGTLVPIGDVDAIAAALARALDNPGSPQQRIDRASDFSPEAIANHYEGLVQTILQAKKA